MRLQDVFLIGGQIPAIIFISGRMIGHTNTSAALVIDLLLHWTHLAPDGIYTIYTFECSCVVVKQIEMTKSNRQQVWQDVIWPSYCNDGIANGHKLLADLDRLFAITRILDSCNPEYLRLHGT